MANNYWRGTTDTDGNTAANWSGGRVPTDTDVAYFDGDGLVNCSFSGAISCQGLVTVAAYTKAIDLDSADAGLVFTLGSSGMVLDNGTGSTFVCGAAVIGITGGPLDNYHATGWNENTSSITVNSTSSVTSKYQNSFYNLTFAAGSTVTIAADTPFVKHLLTLNSAVVLNNRLTVTGNGDLVINAGASFSGASYLEIYVSSSGHGLITLDPSVTTPKIVMSYPLTGSRLVAGTYAGLVQVSRGGYGYTVKLTLNAGTYNFNGGLTIANSGTQILTFDNSTNGPAISVTNLTIDIDSTSGITLDDSGQAVNWTITGNVVDERTGAGTFTWTKGTGTITFSGAADQNVDLMDRTVEDIVFDKSAGTLTLSGGFTTDSLTETGTGGTIDFNDQSFTVTGRMDCAGVGTILSGTGTITCLEYVDLTDQGTWTDEGSTLLLSGAGNQTLLTDGITLGTLQINKTDGYTVIASNLQCAVFLGTSTGAGLGFDPNGYDVTITGNCTWAAAFIFYQFDASGVMHDGTWTIGGDWTADGQTLPANFDWFLNVTGTAVAANIGTVEHCDASGGTEIDAHLGPWNDGGDNHNWNFGVGAFAGRSSILGGGVLAA